MYDSIFITKYNCVGCMCTVLSTYFFGLSLKLSIHVMKIGSFSISIIYAFGSPHQSSSKNLKKPSRRNGMKRSNKKKTPWKEKERKCMIKNCKINSIYFICSFSVFIFILFTYYTFLISLIYVICVLSCMSTTVRTILIQKTLAFTPTTYRKS